MLPPVEMLPALVGLFDEALLLVDGAGQLVWCNAQAQALLEPPVEGTAVDWADRLPAPLAVRSALRDLVAAATGDGTVGHGRSADIELALGDEPAGFRVQAQALPAGPSGGVDRCLLVLRDQRERRHAERELARLRAMLATPPTAAHEQASPATPLGRDGDGGPSLTALARPPDTTQTQTDVAISRGHVAIWRHDLHTDLVQLNASAEQMMGLPHAPGGLSLAELRARVHPEDRARVAASADSALQDGRPTDIEARFAAVVGGWRTLLTRRVLERGADGRPAAFVGIALDVTEQALERRRATELMRRMELATAAAGVGVWSYDTATDEAQWNAQMFALVGRDPALGAPDRHEWRERVIHPADRERVARWRTALDAVPGGAGEQSFRVILPGGEVRWLENRVRSEVLDGHPTVLGVTLDITDRRRAEDALRNADERAALAARSAGIGTWALDFDGEDEHWDAQMFRLRGLEPRAQPPSRAERLALLHPDDRAAVFDARVDASGDALPAAYEFRVRWPDGSYRWLASRSIALFDDAGTPLRRIGVNWDINDARLAEVDRQERELAQREVIAKSRFLARVSHELRTPLNAVLGFTQLLLDGAGLTPLQQQRLGLIRSAGEHLLLLINDMLDLTAIESGELRLSMQPVALDALLAETLPLVEAQATRQQVVLRADGVTGTVRADRMRLRQVLINLLSNAIKYNRPQGAVTLSTSVTDGKVRLVVGDSGRGLSADQMAHLFEPFNRLGAEREGIEGTGIGLVIVKALVERMGGSVGVSSAPGEGTRVAIELSAADAPAHEAPNPGRITPPASVPPRGRLLYIEDNPVNALLVQELVAYRPGLALELATTGQQGVDMAAASPPDLALVDMQLPDFDGFEVLRRLRQDPRTHHLPCIALSANALTEDIARALAAGFADYWTKPLNFDRFLAGLDDHFAAGPPPPG